MRPFLVLSLVGVLTACTDSRAQDSATPSADFSSAIALRSAGECRFDPRTEHAFEGLMLIGWEPDSVTYAPVVALGDQRLEPRFEHEALAGVPDGHDYRAQVSLPDGATWHGLKIERLWVEFVAPPETDSLYRRGIHFAATPEQVHRTLAAQGAEVPLRPEYRELDDGAAFAAQTCGGAILIEPEAGGASLVCDRGC